MLHVWYVHLISVTKFCCVNVLCFEDNISDAYLSFIYNDMCSPWVLAGRLKHIGVEKLLCSIRFPCISYFRCVFCIYEGKHKIYISCLVFKFQCLLWICFPLLFFFHHSSLIKLFVNASFIYHTVHTSLLKTCFVLTYILHLYYYFFFTSLHKTCMDFHLLVLTLCFL